MRSYLKKIIPANLRFLYQKVVGNYSRLRNKKYRALIINYLKGKESLEAEEQEVLDFFLKNNKIAVFPYPCFDDYREEDIKIDYDKQLRMNYTCLFNGKKLYFKRKMSTGSCRRYINSLLAEQDQRSPHCYLSPDFSVSPDSVVVDAGVAEGLFALSIIESARKVYLFEPDPEWLESLHETFAPWKDKVIIIPRFVAQVSGKTTISFDDYFADKEYPSFIKADIEGFEEELLLGSKNILSSAPDLKIAICTYHKQNHYQQLSSLLTKEGFSVAPSRGFMFFYTDSQIAEPYLRRGVLRATKRQ